MSATDGWLIFIYNSVLILSSPNSLHRDILPTKTENLSRPRGSHTQPLYVDSVTIFGPLLELYRYSRASERGRTLGRRPKRA